MTEVLEEQHFLEIFGGFQKFHIGAFINSLNKNNNKGGILPFVRGLRLSAQLIYAMRDILSSTNLKVSWGHILDKNGIYCSRECDIIIHKKGHKTKWNGKKKGVMDFKFIEQDNVIAVISCKSFVTTSVIKKETNYCTDIKKMVSKVFLFGECCSPQSVKTLGIKARLVGFDDFWHSYTWDKKSDKFEPNYKGWNNFIKEIQKLK